MDTTGLPGAPPALQGRLRPVRGTTCLPGTLQACQGRYTPVRAQGHQARGVPARPVVPLAVLWCPCQDCDTPDRPVVPLAGLWAPGPQGGGHDPCDPPLGSAPAQLALARLTFLLGNVYLHKILTDKVGTPVT